LNHRQLPHYANDGESLQADVMRFMAIIAFCLIAVLALVRSVEPATPPVPAPPQPEPVPAVPQPELVPAVPQPEPTPAAPVPQARPEPLEEAAPVSTPAPQPATARVPVSQIAVPTQKIAPAKGLSLRFTSDSDFLRLVTRGEIQVFAYQTGSRGHAVFGLDRNFEFLSTSAPGQVYELLPQTIPNLIAVALDRATPDAHTYSWGIRIPKVLEGKIRKYIDRQARGELVIDRYGEVHHVAS